MNTVSSILVHVDALPRTGTRLELALTLARRLDASVTALYGAVPSVLQLASPFPWSERSLQETWAIDQQRREQCVFRRIVTADFGIVTGHSGRS